MRSEENDSALVRKRAWPHSTGNRKQNVVRPRMRSEGNDLELGRKWAWHPPTRGCRGEKDRERVYTSTSSSH